MNDITSVITGDIINSTNVSANIWLPVLKQALKMVEIDASYSEIYRGDSFQIEIRKVTESFKAATYIKACIKTIKGLDVRMAIGVGDKTYTGKSVTESNGKAFQFSGETLETLKSDKCHLKIKTSHKKLDTELNLYFKLALISMDNWTVNSAEIVKLRLEHPEMLQKELAQFIGINQNAVSYRLKRAHVNEILELDALYRIKINTLAI